MSTPNITYDLERHTYSSHGVQRDSVFFYGPLTAVSANGVTFCVSKELVKATSTVLGDLVDTFDPSQTLIFDDPAIESHPVIRAVFALSRSEPVPYPVLCTIEANLPAIKEFIHKWDCPAVEAALPAALCLAERQRINKNQSIYMVSLEWRFNDCRDLVKEYGLEGLGFPTNKGAGGPACMHLPYVFLQRIPPVHAHALLAAHLAEVAGKTREQVVETYHHTIVNGLPGSPPRGWRS